MGLRRSMTTIYLDDKHYEYFKNNTEESMSSVVRKALDKYLESNNKKKKD